MYRLFRTLTLSVERSRFLPSAVGAGLLGLSAAGWAAVPVEESVAAGAQAREAPVQENAGTPGTSGGAGAGGGDAQLGELFYELQVLRQEVQELRGLVEEQGYRLDRLARDQQEQYLDLDRRMQALRGGGGASGEQGGGGSSGAFAGGDPAREEAPTGATGGAPTSEREAYAEAFDLMKERRFGASIDAFNQLIVNYPNGAYTPNAFYWLGELYLAEEQNEQARQSFAQVINLYPDHQKVPDALYKMGVVYHQLGDVERAREYLNQVRREYPESSAAGLAETFLAEL